MKRKWDIADDEVQKKCIDEVIARIEEIGEAGVGVIAAQDVIDIVTENLAPEIYNSGVRDAKKMLERKFEDLEIEIDSLEQATR